MTCTAWQSASNRFVFCNLSSESTCGIETLFTGRRDIWRERVTLQPKLPWASQLFLNFLTKLDELFRWETKSWLREKGDLHSWVTLFRWYGHSPPQANFSVYKHFGLPTHVNSVKGRWLEHARAMLSLEGQLLPGAKGSTFLSYNCSLKLTQQGGWPSCQEQLLQYFSLHKRGLNFNKNNFLKNPHR